MIDHAAQCMLSAAKESKPLVPASKTKRRMLQEKERKCFVAKVKLALIAKLEAKPGKESEVENFLKSALPLVEEEPGTIAWFAIRMGTSSFGIFDVFNDDAGREAHLNGKVAAALMAKAAELFAKPPEIQKWNVLESKL
jgi:quinol monooxygenase YgiN